MIDPPAAITAAPTSGRYVKLGDEDAGPALDADLARRARLIAASGGDVEHADRIAAAIGWPRLYAPKLGWIRP